MAHHQTRTALFTLGLIAIAAVPLSGGNAAQAGPATTVELSAQSSGLNPNAIPNPKNKKPGQKNIKHNRPNVQPRVNIRKQQLHVQPRQKLNVQKKQVIVPQNQRRIHQNKPIHVQKQQNIIIPKKKVIVVPQGPRRKKFVGQPRVFKPKHQNVVVRFKLKNSNQAFLHGKNYSVHRRDYRVRRNGRLFTFVALGVLAPLVIGAATYYPYAYLNVPEDYCEGRTDDGCEMVYDEVETADSEAIPQCVAYCPWQ